MRVLVFGDSITQGYWATDHGWVDLIRKHYDTLQFTDLDGRDEPTIFNLGISADNSENILNRVEAEIVARYRDHHSVKPVIVVQIGINDSSTGTGQPSVHVDQEGYRKNLEQIIQIGFKYSAKIILVGLTACNDKKTNPASWGDYYYKNKNIQIYENIMAEVATEQGVDFIPVFDQFNARVEAGEDLLPDGLHPNDAGHNLIYEIVMPKLQELLK